MLSPEQIDALAESLVHGHQEAFTRDLLEQLVHSLTADGELSVRDLRTLEQVAASNRDSLTRLVNTTRHQQDAEVRKLVTDALNDAAAWDLATVALAHPGAVLSGASYTAARVASQTAEGLVRIIARDNLQMVAKAQRTWYDVTAEAITRYNSGAYSTDRIISDAVRRMRAEGTTVIDYASGAKASIDVAVRRHVIAQSSQASGRITDSILDAIGHDLVYTSAHLGSRPEHCVWQGKAFRRGGAATIDGVHYPGFEEATGLGTVTGLQGANCRHSWAPFFPGITELPEIPKPPNGMSEEEYYDLTQQQRAYERAIRKTKAEIADMRVAGLDDTAGRLKLGKQQKRIKAFTETHGLDRQPLREKAYGIGDQPRALRKARASVTPPRNPRIDEIEHLLGSDTIEETGWVLVDKASGKYIKLGGSGIELTAELAEGLKFGQRKGLDKGARKKGYEPELQKITQTKQVPRVSDQLTQERLGKELKALLSGYPDLASFEAAERAAAKTAADVFVKRAESSWIGGAVRKDLPLVERFGDEVAYNKTSIIELFSRTAKKELGAVEVHTSATAGSKFSSSVYLKVGNVEVRISDHELPVTAARLDSSYRTRWDTELVFDDHEIEKLLKLKGKDAFVKYVRSFF